MEGAATLPHILLSRRYGPGEARMYGKYGKYGKYEPGEVTKGEIVLISAEGLVSTFDFRPALCASGCLWRYRGADRLHTPLEGKQARQSETKNTFCPSFERGGENGGSQKTKSRW